MEKLIDKFMNNMKQLSDREYMYNIITYGIAPTICGYKCATLLTFSNKYMNSYRLWKAYRNEFLNKIPLKYYELNATEETCTVLFYNEEALNKAITENKCISFLKNIGYEENIATVKFLERLRIRYKVECPHEIGIFLGIPLHDVVGFIENEGKNYLYCGYWKVYEDLERALTTFENYNKSKRMVIEQVSLNKNIFEIIVLLSCCNAVQLAQQTTGETLF